MRWKKFKSWLKESRWRQAGLAIFIAVMLIVAGFLTWALTPMGPMDEARDALRSDEDVLVTTDRWLVFEPRGVQTRTAFVFYPGARVDPRSYAPMARDIAAEGFLVVVVPMRLNLAIFSSGAASDVIDEYGHIDNWVVGGHSLGGAMAARYAYRNVVDGLVMWAAYPGDDLSGLEISALSIYGTRDGVSTVDDILGREDKMPTNTTWVPISGGNHAQFSWYGSQRGDNEAAISREEQQSVIVQETAGFLGAF